MAKKPQKKPAQKPAGRFPQVPSIKKRAFLAAFGECGNIARAAAAARCSRRAHTKWLDDPEYARAFADAREEAADMLEAEARQRAVKGLKRFKFHCGKPIIDPQTEQPYYELEYSDTLLIFLLKRARPDKYAAHVKIEDVDQALDVFDSAKLAALREAGLILKELEDAETA